MTPGRHRAEVRRADRRLPVPGPSSPCSCETARRRVRRPDYSAASGPVGAGVLRHRVGGLTVGFPAAELRAFAAKQTSEGKVMTTATPTPAARRGRAGDARGECRRRGGGRFTSLASRAYPADCRECVVAEFVRVPLAPVPSVRPRRLTARCGPKGGRWRLPELPRPVLELAKQFRPAGAARTGVARRGSRCRGGARGAA